ncbi:RagB/SusD family nutrient uptake outer membrane protein [Dysgonomonas sp. 511]|nr:RagB/SusD family nutrient uptake outer membrane protein [Dysgonomonas sp. 511]NDV78085.1 RagB/SusD family nutrient uptake outer membrane protein [Dysgonomonas sp. 511]
MKMKKIYGLSTAFLMAILVLTGCSDQFLEDKRNFSNAGDEIFDNYVTAEALINDLYLLSLPASTSGITYQYPSAGTSDAYSQATEEYAGLSFIVDDGVVLTTSSTQMLSLFYNERKTSNNPYGRIRTCNDAIRGIEQGALNNEEKAKLLGQVYFFRAWTYYRLVKEFGGVPIVTEVQNAIIGDDGGISLFVPRSTTKQCIDYICDDLDKAANYLSSVNWGNDSDYGRVTAGTALALQGRARLLYASPVFNRADNADRWTLAYQSNKAAIERLKTEGRKLAYLDDPGENASGWAKMFAEYNSPEAVFVTLYNNVAKPTGTTNPAWWNGWENSIRPANTGANTGKNTTSTMIDLFPMVDGKKPGQSVDYPYDPDLFMLNRDPRFYRTFGFPGVRWAYAYTGSNGYGNGTNYELWNYSWYISQESKESPSDGGYAGDKLGTDYKGVYVRKRTDDADLNSTALYVYEVDGTKCFQRSAAPYMEIRYAEVLLNFAEAACGVGQYSEALEALRDIRRRVGYTGNCGLEDGLAGDRGKLFGAILYERQIELAYEGKRFDDMRRWMLWDGGVGQSAIKSTWALTGFGGNTCNYLGLTPFNGTNRKIVELRVSDDINNGLSSSKDVDPLLADRPKAWNLKTEASPSAELVKFYTEKLKRKERKGDDLDKVISFKPKYYIGGLKENAQRTNPKLEQNIGWEDYMNGNAPGTFDPLAE